MNTPQDDRCPIPPSKKRRTDDDDDDDPTCLETRKSTVNGKPQQRPYGPLAMEPCSISRLKDHILFLQSEVEEYQELINMKFAEIEHAKYRVEYLKSVPSDTSNCNTKTDISVFKQQVKSAIAKAFDTNAVTTTSRLDDPTLLQEIKEELLGEIVNVNFKDGNDVTASPESVAETDAIEQIVHIPGPNEFKRGSSFSSIPPSFAFPTGRTRFTGWRNWLLGSIHVEGNKRWKIKPYRLICTKELHTKELIYEYNRSWKSIFTKMMEAPGIAIPPNYEDINEAFVQSSFDIATEHLKEQYSYIFEKPENITDTYELGTWAQKIKASLVRKDGNPADIEKLPPLKCPGR